MLPAGSVTFLFTDIEGSTTRWEHHPEAMRAALERHDALLHAVIQAGRGHVFKTVGDAFCAAFGGAGDAVVVAIEIQRAVGAEDWGAFGPDFPPMRVRIGLHTGPAESRAGDYFGPSVNRAARLQAAGHGGQILLSDATRALVAGGLPTEITLRDWGIHRLKDLRHAERIFQVCAPGMMDVTAPLRTSDNLQPRDRILVEDPRAEASDAARQMAPLTRRPVNLWESLAAAVRREDEVVVLAPQELQAIAARTPGDLTEYRLGRIAEWSQPRYRLDGRFVALTLLLDQGEEAGGGRWESTSRRYSDLYHVLGEVPDPALVLLGPPGSGKSTLLRQIELEVAIQGLRGEDPGDRVTFLVPLNLFKPSGTDDPTARRWLSERWAARFPHLPPLEAFLRDGRVVFLLDALNEMPVDSEESYRARVGLWKAWLNLLVSESPGNRVVFACRSLDYSAPLSTPALRVPQVRIEPMSDDQVRAFLNVYSPHLWRETWMALKGTPQLEVVRSPFFLKLLTEQVETAGEVPTGRAALFTGFVRQALRRELERDNPLFAVGGLVERRDARRVIAWRWGTPWDLPERGPLIPRLAGLAYGMQGRQAGGEASQVRVDFDTALSIVGDAQAEAIVRAGEALAVLDEDTATGEVMFVHQLIQEYFAARRLAAAPDTAVVRQAWRADEIQPSLVEVIRALAPSEPLPRLSTTGWEETSVMAAAMTPDPAAYVRDVMAANLALAGRCAAQPELRDGLPPILGRELRQALVARSRDPDADLRARIAAGLALGPLGDPRFERREGRHGMHLVPPLVAIPGGVYPIGPEMGDPTAPGAVHSVVLGRFRIGRFATTNAEWSCFMAAGGYDDERWWDTPTARAWRRGDLTAEGRRSAWRYWRASFLADPGLIDVMRDDGRLVATQADEWRELVGLSEAAFESLLCERFVDERRTRPRYWEDEDYNNPAQPVVGVSWFEARAYCRWLAAQTGVPFRLPTEAEWEAAARGPEGRPYPYGDTLDPLRGNIFATQVRQPTPVGVFPAGDTPEGVADMAGNTQDWTSTLHRPYPYDAADGREDPEPGNGFRVIRGGAFYGKPESVRATYRFRFNPLFRRLRSTGFRVCAAD